MKPITLAGKVRGESIKFIPEKADGTGKMVQVSFSPFGGGMDIALKVKLEPVDAKDRLFHEDIVTGDLYEAEIRLKPIARAEQTDMFKGDKKGPKGVVEGAAAAADA